MGMREKPAWAEGTVGLTAARERGDIQREFQSRLTVTRSMIDRLGLEKELHGHGGCVNCLEWNRDGSILASASDDLHVILWDPYRYKQLQNISTGHTGNIFSVKFLSPDVLATCAADGTVRVRSLTGSAPLLECACHCGRVKRLATAPDNPHLLWSAGEDGVILQHDLRTSHRCNSDSATVLVNLLNHLGRYAEAKCVAVNPRRPYQLAVGANDFYVRLYDTRLIKLSRLQQNSTPSRQMWERQNVRCLRAGQGDPHNNIPRAAVQYFAPGHLSTEPNDQTFPKKATTYVTFSHDGNELLVNLGSEQVYLFDINSAQRPVLVENFIIQHNRNYEDGDKLASGANGTTANGTTANGTTANGTQESPEPQLPDRVHRLKEMANELVNAGSYAAAVELYNSALSLRPSAVLWANRAAALMRRGWAGDAYAAVRDCYRAVRRDPAHVKAHFRLAKALLDARRAAEARDCLLYFQRRFPRHAASHAVCLLQRDVQLALEARTEPPDDDAPPTSALERQLRADARDYAQRFLGHCNTTTDIKEANFLGPEGRFVAAGSDDGSLFVWCRASGNIVRCLRADDSIVNCVQPHPHTCLVATSGIETVVRLWSPRGASAQEPRAVVDAAAAAATNQQRMRSDPFEAMLLNISFAGGADRDLHSHACRTT